MKSYRLAEPNQPHPRCRGSGELGSWWLRSLSWSKRVIVVGWVGAAGAIRSKGQVDSLYFVVGPVAVGWYRLQNNPVGTGVVFHHHWTWAKSAGLTPQRDCFELSHSCKHFGRYMMISVLNQLGFDSEDRCCCSKTWLSWGKCVWVRKVGVSADFFSFSIKGWIWEERRYNDRRYYKTTKVNRIAQELSF